MLTFLSRLFAPAEHFSASWRRALESEGVLADVEEVPTTITYRNYSRPGKACSWNRRLGYSTAITLTNHRLIIFERRQKLLNLPFNSPFWNDVSVTLRDQRTLRIVANVSAFPGKHRGEIELWLATSGAQRLFELVSLQRSAATVSRGL